MGNSHGALGMGTWCPRAAWAMETPDRGSPIQPLSYWGEQGGKNGFARAGMGPGCSSKGDAVALNDIDVHPNGYSSHWVLTLMHAAPSAQILLLNLLPAGLNRAQQTSSATPASNQSNSQLLFYIISAFCWMGQEASSDSGSGMRMYGWGKMVHTCATDAWT